MNSVPFVQSNARGTELILPATILLERRVVYIDSEITQETVSSYIQQIMVLSLQSREDITIIINSPGGSIQDGLALIDVMQSCGCRIRTLVLGMAASMSAILLAAGTKGMRYATPNSRVMIHEPRMRSGLSGSCSEIQICAAMVKESKSLMISLLSEFTGQPEKVVDDAISYDHYMKCAEAVRFGLIDRIVSRNMMQCLFGSKEGVR